MATGIDRLLNQLASGGGLFSPITPFHSQKRLARAVAPALVGAAGGVRQAGLRGGYGLRSALAQARGGVARESMAGKYGLKAARVAEDWQKYKADQMLAGAKYGSTADAKVIQPLINMLIKKLGGDPDSPVAKPGPHIETVPGGAGPVAKAAAEETRDEDITPTYATTGDVHDIVTPAERIEEELSSYRARIKQRDKEEMDYFNSPSYQRGGRLLDDYDY